MRRPDDLVCVCICMHMCHTEKGVFSIVEFELGANHTTFPYYPTDTRLLQALC